MGSHGPHYYIIGNTERQEKYRKDPGQKKVAKERRFSA
jgi:hypothetical protein